MILRSLLQKKEVYNLVIKNSNQDILNQKLIRLRLYLIFRIEK